MKYLWILAIFPMFVGCNNNEHSTNTVHDSSGKMQDSTVHMAEHTGGMANAMNSMMEDMKKMEITGDPDHDFATMMKRHHEGAIEMANIEIASGKNEELKTMARKMLSDQQTEIKGFNNFLRSHKPQTKTSFAENSMKKMNQASEMHLEMHGADVDLDFATMMIQHHQHAIDMSKEYLKTARAEEMKKIAGDIISAQQAEIKQLNNWKAEYKPGTH